MEETPQIHNHLTANSHISKKDIILGNFLGGLFWGLGTVIGATVVVGLLVWIFHLINFVPVVGNVVNGLGNL